MPEVAVDRGSCLTIEVEFQTYTPFGSYAYADASPATITITDEDGTVKVNGAALTKSATGKYYYKCQTLITWIVGEYVCSVSATIAGDSDITIKPRVFYLK